MADKYKRFLPYLISFVVLLVVRYLLFQDLDFVDYDAAMNFMMSRDIAHGDFSQMFHHASPLFNLFVAGLLTMAMSPTFVLLVLSGLQIIGIMMVSDVFLKRNDFSLLTTILILLVGGSSVYLVVSSGYLAMESVTIFLVGWMVRSIDHKNENIGAPWLIVSLLLLVNYKAVLLVPILFIVEWKVLKRPVHLSALFKRVLFFCIPILVMILMGMMVGHSLLQYPKAFYQLASGMGVNPLHEISRFNLDLTYYFQFLTLFENPLLLPGVFVVLVGYRRFYRQESRPLILYAGIALLFLLGMSLLQKAPRGLIFVYPMMWVILCGAISSFVRLKNVLYGLLIALNIALIGIHVWPHKSSDAYQKMSAYIHEERLDHILVTGGIGVEPYLNEGVTTKVIFRPTEISELKEQGWKYLLIDPMYRVVGSNSYQDFRNQPQLYDAGIPKIIRSPYLFLEHSEFRGTGFWETLASGPYMVKGQDQRLVLYKLE